MVKTPINIFIMYGLVGLAIAGGVIAVSHVTSTVVPVFPKYGQLSIDLVLSPSVAPQPGSSAPLTDYAEHEDDTLRVTADSVMVYHGGTVNPTTSWTTLQDETGTVTLRTGVKVHLGSLTLPEGNVNLVRVKIASATIQRGSIGMLADVGIQSSQLDIATHARVTAQTTTNVLIDFKVACPAIIDNSSGHSECRFTTSAENED